MKREEGGTEKAREKYPIAEKDKRAGYQGLNNREFILQQGGER